MGSACGNWGKSFSLTCVEGGSCWSLLFTALCSHTQERQFTTQILGACVKDRRKKLPFVGALALGFELVIFRPVLFHLPISLSWRHSFPHFAGGSGVHCAFLPEAWLVSVILLIPLFAPSVSDSLHPRSPTREAATTDTLRIWHPWLCTQAEGFLY